MSRGELARKIYKRGRCPKCGFRYRLTKEGLLYTHSVYVGGEGTQCEGSGAPPQELRPSQALQDRMDPAQ